MRSTEMRLNSSRGSCVFESLWLMGSQAAPTTPVIAPRMQSTVAYGSALAGTGAALEVAVDAVRIDKSIAHGALARIFASTVLVVVLVDATSARLFGGARPGQDLAFGGSVAAQLASDDRGRSSLASVDTFDTLQSGERS